MDEKKVKAILSDFNILAWCFAVLSLILAVVPSKGAFGKMSNFDKFAHFVIFYFLVLFVTAAHGWQHRLRYLFYGLAFGFMIEVIQLFLPWREGDIVDFAMDSLGALLAVLTPQFLFPLIMDGIATIMGVGFLPLMPGTFASLVALALYHFLPVNSKFLVFTVPAISLVGLWAAEHFSGKLGKNDPSEVVVDEFAGALIAVMFLPKKPSILIAGFFLFRFFDIFKPWIINKSQRLPGGLGVMADDWLAGVFANVVLRLVHAVLL